jgi:hypothetical protein
MYLLLLSVTQNELEVTFPLKGLNISDYCTERRSQYCYDLFAVANHHGRQYWRTAAAS